MRWLLLASALIGCGGGSREPASEPSPLDPATAPTANTATDASAPAPSRDAPKVYADAACTARVALLQKRLDAASDAYHAWSVATKLPLGASDADLIAPTAIVRVIDARKEVETCGAYDVEVTEAGQKPRRYEGASKVTNALAQVKKRFRAGQRIGIELGEHRMLSFVTTLLSGLSKIGPLSMRVTVEGAPFAVPVDDAPTWALERDRAYMEPHRKASPKAILADALTAAVPNCPAFTTANAELAIEDGRDAEAIIAREFPRAIAACSCAAIDVDAFELFATRMIIRDWVKAWSVGWIEIAIDSKTSAPVSRDITKESHGGRIANDLVALTREQRRAPLQLEPQYKHDPQGLCAGP